MRKVNKTYGPFGKCGFAFLVLLFSLRASAQSTTPVDISERERAERIEFNEQVLNRVEKLLLDRFYDVALDADAWRRVSSEYRAAILGAEDNARLSASLNAMLAALHVSHLEIRFPGEGAMSTTQATEMRPAGFMFQVYGNRAVVNYVDAGSQLAKAGVRKGWVMKQGLGFNEATADQSGSGELEYSIPFVNAGKSAHIVFEDDLGNEHVVNVDPCNQPVMPFLERIGERSGYYDPVYVEEIEEGVVYARIDTFDNEHVMRSFRERLEAIDNLNGLIIDLRYNRGGRLDSMRIILGHVFTENVLAGYEAERNKRPDRIRSWSWKSVEYTGPLVVLTNQSTRSAAEIFAHVVQFYKRGVIVGRTTAGEVLGSRPFELPGGGMMQIPVSNYISLDGSSLEGTGVTPDYQVPPPTLETARQARDMDIEAALEIIRTQSVR